MLNSDDAFAGIPLPSGLKNQIKPLFVISFHHDFWSPCGTSRDSTAMKKKKKKKVPTLFPLSFLKLEKICWGFVFCHFIHIAREIYFKDIFFFKKPWTKRKKYICNNLWQFHLQNGVNQNQYYVCVVQWVNRLCYSFHYWLELVDPRVDSGSADEGSVET